MKTMKQLLRNCLLSSKLVCLLLCCTFSCKAQVNYLIDGSFEDTVNNWQNINSAKSLKNWQWFLNDTEKIIGVAVLNSSISSNINTLLPFTIFTVYPHSGYNAQELVTHYDLDKTYFDSIGWNYLNMRTPIRSKLNQKLIAGKLYCGTVWVVAQKRQTYYNTNGIGMYFDNGQLDTVITKLHDSSGIYGRYCQAQVISYQVISDSANWTKVQGSFIANGTEECVTIGNWLTDTTQTKVLNGPAAWQLPGQFFSEYLIDDASVIPIDIHDWLHDTFCAIGDSVWVGLHPLDYGDGIWYNYPMQSIPIPIVTGQGFWFKPTQAVTKFIQAIDVCGAMVYDTLSVYAYPLLIDNGKLIMEN
jgi:hypothetical protein